MIRYLTLAAVTLLLGCNAPKQLRPDLDVPAKWRSESLETASLGDLPWGDLFRNADLPPLINEALRSNSDLRIATIRAEIVWAQYGIQTSYLFPSLFAVTAVNKSRQPGIGKANAVNDNPSVGLTVPVWELDLWGRLRSLSDAALHEAMAADQTRRAVRVSLIAQVTLAYLELLQSDAELAVAQRTLETRRQSLRLVDLRFQNGTASALDVEQAKSLLAGADATVADVERRGTQAENLLSVLVGRNPGPIARSTKLAQFATPSNLPPGLPSRLIERRPDILAAERRLDASGANLSAARAAFFPVISITGFLGFVSPQLAGLFDGGRYAWSATPEISAPIFTAGRLDSNLKVAQAQQSLALEQYRQTIRTAFREVEDALAAHQRLGEQLNAQNRLAASDRERLRLTRMRYDNGVSSYFEVLDSERQAFSSQLAVIQITQALYASVVQLYRVLGGGADDARKEDFATQ